MKLLEVDAKAILMRYGLPVPQNKFLDSTEEAPADWLGGAAVKAQVMFGGRGKLGLVQISGPEALGQTIASVRQRLSERGLQPLVMLEQPVAVQAEYYLSIRIDDIHQRAELIFSTRGGVEIEAHADALNVMPITPLAPLYAHQLIPFFRQSGVPGRQIGPLARFAAQAYRLFCLEDADLLEINPLGVTERGDVIALDAKLNLDDSAEFRHPERKDWLSGRMRHASLTPLEREAQAHGLTFIELDGNVAVLSGGAGLGMLVLDAIVDTGNKPANFVDAIGGASPETFRRQVKLILDHASRPEIEAIVTFFTLTATSLASIVNAILDVTADKPAPKPMIVGLLAGGAAEAEMSLEQAKAVLGARGIECVTELVDLMNSLSRILPRNRKPA